MRVGKQVRGRARVRLCAAWSKDAAEPEALSALSDACAEFEDEEGQLCAVAFAHASPPCAFVFLSTL